MNFFRSNFWIPKLSRNRVNQPFGLLIPGLKETNETLDDFGIKLPNEALLSDLASLVGGGQLKEEIELQAEIKFNLFRSLPWWVKMLESINPTIENRAQKQNLITWKTLKCLSSLKLPGYRFDSRLISASVLFFIIDMCIKKFKCPSKEVFAVLAEATEIATSLTEEEVTLLSCLPSDSEMAKLPEKLQAQFDKAKEDAEFFFSGETFQTHYAIGKVIRCLRKRMDPKVRSEIHDVLDLLSHPGRFLVISTSRKLEKLDSFVLVKTQRFTPDPSGQEIRFRRMTNLSEIPRIQSQTLAFAVLYPKLFLEKVVRNEALVRERGTILQLRQSVCLMIDKSPSMLFKGNLFKAIGILFNRLLAVLSRDAYVMYQFFDDELSTESTADDPIEAQLAMKFAKAENFIGSGTNINQALLTAKAKLATLPPELRRQTQHIVLVTDGRDNVTVTPEEMQGIKVHVFVMGGSNHDLRKICQQTDGVYYENI